MSLSPYTFARPALAVAMVWLLSASPAALACGGFFCQNLPIDQAGEQIVFRQEGDSITAMVRILYTGQAEDFSWVVPVPNSPEISLGADATFNELDLSTRPQFLLIRQGEECPFDQNTPGVADAASAPQSETDDGSGVVIEETLAVGPFDIQIVSSDNPDDLAIWLIDNGYDLTDRGRDLIEPYVLDGMKFVALKLRRGEQTGSIQPLIMKYQSSKPMIPIRLTAVAALDNMGVQVWVVGDARAVPENYLHVTPNYSRINWFTGTSNAYASYQTLITAAMDEAGGQGFATDFAGRIDKSITSSLTTAEQLEGSLANLNNINSDAEFLADSLFLGNSSATLAVLQNALPLPVGQNTQIYFDAAALQITFTATQLAEARSTVIESIQSRDIEPLRAATRLLPEGAYMTRLYTTLSADEMTLDPEFVYNATMPDQALSREALLEASCGDNGTEWTLTLGKGTDRDGEKVITANQPVPFSVPNPVATQPAAWTRARTSADAEPEILVQESLGTLEIFDNGTFATAGQTANDDDNGFLGATGLWTIALLPWLIRRSVKIPVWFLTMLACYQGLKAGT